MQKLKIPGKPGTFLSDHQVCQYQTNNDEDFAKEIRDHNWEVLSWEFLEEVGIDKH
jgi:hypothetical protein